MLKYFDWKLSCNCEWGILVFIYNLEQGCVKIGGDIGTSSQSRIVDIKIENASKWEIAESDLFFQLLNVNTYGKTENVANLSICIYKHASPLCLRNFVNKLFFI